MFGMRPRPKRRVEALSENRKPLPAKKKKRDLSKAVEQDKHGYVLGTPRLPEVYAVDMCPPGPVAAIDRPVNVGNVTGSAGDGRVGFIGLGGECWRVVDGNVILRHPVIQASSWFKAELEVMVAEDYSDPQVFARRVSRLSQSGKGNNGRERLELWETMVMLWEMQEKIGSGLERIYMSDMLQRVLRREVESRLDCEGMDRVKNAWIVNDVNTAVEEATKLGNLKLATILSQGMELFSHEVFRQDMDLQVRGWASDGTMELMDPKMSNMYSLLANGPSCDASDPLCWMFEFAWKLWRSPMTDSIASVWTKCFPTDPLSSKGSPAYWILKLFVTQKSTDSSLTTIRRLLQECCFTPLDVSLAWETIQVLPHLFPKLVSVFDVEKALSDRINTDMSALLCSVGRPDLSITVAQHCDLLKSYYQHRFFPVPRTSHRPRGLESLIQVTSHPYQGMDTEESLLQISN